jgi:hypothetical protein
MSSEVPAPFVSWESYAKALQNQERRLYAVCANLVEWIEAPAADRRLTKANLKRWAAEARRAIAERKA